MNHPRPQGSFAPSPYPGAGSFAPGHGNPPGQPPTGYRSTAYPPTGSPSAAYPGSAQPHAGQPHVSPPGTAQSLDRSTAAGMSLPTSPAGGAAGNSTGSYAPSSAGLMPSYLPAGASVRAGALSGSNNGLAVAAIVVVAALLALIGLSALAATTSPEASSSSGSSSSSAPGAGAQGASTAVDLADDPPPGVSDYDWEIYVDLAREEGASDAQIVAAYDAVSTIWEPGLCRGYPSDDWTDDVFDALDEDGDGLLGLEDGLVYIAFHLVAETRC